MRINRHVEQGVIGPKPSQAGGPPIWAAVPYPLRWNERASISMAGSRPVSTRSAAASSGVRCRRIAREAVHDRGAVEAAIYLTLAVDNNANKAQQRIRFLVGHYGQAASGVLLGPGLGGGRTESAAYLLLRFAGDPDRHRELWRSCARRCPH
ncbi:MAG: hypothetical protein ACXWIH_11770 [Burkholderiales bacterium]